jgi:hypothetical protein
MMTTAAESLNSSGLLDFGYNRVNLDDWYAVRDGNSGKIKGATKNFPSGMAACGQKIHAAGCLFGVYSAASMRTCANFSASLFNEVNDANTFAHDWKIDMLKYDACRYNYGVASRPRYEAMGRALNATGRPILYSVEGWSPAEDSSWGPAVADSWRTGSDIWPNWDNHNVCILNNLYQTNYAAKWHVVGKGFNDPDMLQPPNTLKTVLSPGLTPEEAYSQFKLWVVMKSPLVLGVNWEQIADLKTLEPTYYSLLTNTEVLAVNQDMSPQGILVRQTPSRAQRVGRGNGGAAIPVSLQACDEQHAAQRWVPGQTKGTVELEGTGLCLVRNSTSGATEAARGASGDSEADGTVVLAPCGAASTVWGMQSDDTAVHVGTAGDGGSLCMEADLHSSAPVLKPCIYTGPIPPATVVGASFASQTYVWGPTTQQIVSGGGGTCLTAGLENYPGVNANVWVTNNGTLEHEVWMGDLSTNPDGSRRRVVALFNKGADSDALVAPASLYGRDLPGIDPGTTQVKVRDVVRRRDVTVKPGTPIESSVASHGVDLFVVTYPAIAAQGEL